MKDTIRERWGERGREAPEVCDWASCRSAERRLVKWMTVEEPRKATKLDAANAFRNHHVSIHLDSALLAVCHRIFFFSFVKLITSMQYMVIGKLLTKRIKSCTREAELCNASRERLFTLSR